MAGEFLSCRLAHGLGVTGRAAGIMQGVSGADILSAEVLPRSHPSVPPGCAGCRLRGLLKLEVCDREAIVTLRLPCCAYHTAH